MGVWGQLMRTQPKPISEQEYKDFVAYVKAYNLKKQKRLDRFHRSPFYKFYLLFKK